VCFTSLALIRALYHIDDAFGLVLELRGLALSELLVVLAAVISRFTPTDFDWFDFLILLGQLPLWIFSLVWSTLTPSPLTPTPVCRSYFAREI
jgi:hypothetical protein